MRCAQVALICLLTAGSGGSAEPSQEIDTIVQESAGKGRFSGVALVSQNGQVIYKKGFGFANAEWNLANEPDVKFRLASITKVFTAALILQLASEGKLELEAPFGRYIEEYPRDTADCVTIHHLLTHTSGIPSHTSQSDFWAEVRNPVEPLRLLLQYADLPLEFSPGERFKYNNSGFVLLGIVIERLTGLSYANALRRRIFEPLGLRDSGYDRAERILPRRASGYQRHNGELVNAQYLDMSRPFSAGSIYSTAEDLYRWDRALSSGQVLPAAWRDKLFQEYATVPDLDGKRRTWIGYGWFLERVKHPNAEGDLLVQGHGGGIFGFSTLMHRIPEDDHLIVLLGNISNMQPELNRLAASIREVLYR